jgi:hypothetical protein
VSVPAGTRVRRDEPPRVGEASRDAEDTSLTATGDGERSQQPWLATEQNAGDPSHFSVIDKGRVTRPSGPRDSAEFPGSSTSTAERANVLALRIEHANLVAPGIDHRNQAIAQSERRPNAQEFRSRCAVAADGHDRCAAERPRRDVPSLCASGSRWRDHCAQEAERAGDACKMHGKSPRELDRQLSLNAERTTIVTVVFVHEHSQQQVL